MSVTQTRALNVCLIGFDRRNLNALKLFFTRPEAGQCKLCLADNADLVIVDIDRYGVTDEWAVIQQNHPQTAAVLFSLEVEKHRTLHADHAHVQVLQKPVKMPALLKALESTRESLSEQLQEVSPSFQWVPSDTDADEVDQAAADPASPDDETQVAANSQESGISDAAFLAELGTLLDEVKRSVKRANHQGLGIRLHMANQGSIFIDPSEHWIFTDFSDATLRELCTERFNEADITIREFEDGESAKYVEGWTQRRETPLDVDSFLWDLALWTYNGLLPTGTRLEYKVELTSWPDLPRMAPIPFAMRIAALWTSCPVSLIETVEVLNIPATHVFKFYACCYTLGLIKQTDPQVHIEKFRRARPDQERRRFYLNILKHIKGKDFD